MTDAQNPLEELGIADVTDAVEIGSGGFGIVYRAVEADLGRTVAVKVLNANLDEAARFRFERERRAMGTLSGHPNIVTVFRGGHTSTDRAFLVMEYLPRGSLADRLAGEGPLHWSEMLKFGIQLSGALETAHRAGVLHRDIKPGNILVSRFGDAKLCDFGIARLKGAPETQSSVITASIAHAPPEIINGDRPGPISDVYSLASTLYELVSGSPPFVRPTDESMVPILSRIQTEPAPRLDEERLPPGLATILDDAMAKVPTDRPASALDFGRRLSEAQRTLDQPATPLPFVPSTDGDDPVRTSGEIPPATIPPFPDTPSTPLPPPSGTSDDPTATRPSNSLDITPGGSPLPPQVTAARTPDPGTPADPASVELTPYDPTETATPNPRPRPNAIPDPSGPVGTAAPDADHPDFPGPDDEASRAGGPDGSSASAERLRRSAGLGALAALVVVVVGLGLWAALRDPGAGDDPDDVAGPTSAEAAFGTVVAPPTTTRPGTGPADYAEYHNITDASGRIQVEVPMAWSDVELGPDEEGRPVLRAAPQLRTTETGLGMLDDSVVPGVVVSLRLIETSVATPDAALDRLADQEPGCTVAERQNAPGLPGARMQTMVNCGPSGSSVIHYAASPEFSTLMAFMRIQVASGQDELAADAIIQSLTIDNSRISE